MRKIVVSVLCLALIVSSLAFSGSKVQAKTYGPEEFGLGFNVEEYVGIKFQKITKNYVLYKKIKFNGNDGYKYVSNKVYKKEWISLYLEIHVPRFYLSESEKQTYRSCTYKTKKC